MKLFTVSVALYACSILSCKAVKTDPSDTEAVGLNGNGQPWDFEALTAAKKYPCLQVPENFQVPAGLPSGPSPKMTPGRLCHNGNYRRFREKVLMCERDVTNGMKNQVQAAYRQAGQLAASYTDTSQFKVDHYFPLCAGGSNEIENLWPQHKSVGIYTDPIEFRVCSAMHMNVMLQKEALSIIATVKNDLSTAYEICKSLNARIGI